MQAESGSAVRQTARVYSPPPLKLWRGPHPSIRSSVVPAPCAAAWLARVAAKFPLCPRRAVPCKPPHPRPPVRRSCVFAVGPWPSLPQSPLYSPLQPAVVAFRRTYLQGFGASCLRAPGHRRPFAIGTPVAPMGRCYPQKSGKQRPRTRITRPRRKAGRVHVMRRPHPQATAAPIAPRSPRAQGGHSCDRGPRPCGSRRNARTGLPLSFLRWQASCAPQKPGRRNAPRFIEEALGVDPRPGAPFHQIHLPVECTGRANSPSDGRPRASTSALIGT